MDLPQVPKMADPITVSENSFIKIEVEDALPGDCVKPFHIPNHHLSPKREDVPLLNLHSISGPRKFEYDTPESKYSNNEGHISPHESGLHLQGNTSLVVSKNPSSSRFSNGCASESEGKGLENRKRGLISCLQSKKYDVCDQTFSLAGQLKPHQRIHKGEKLFRCGICDKTFSQVHDLKRHQRVHTGEKPFKCDVCDQTFSQAGQLKPHQRIHTGEKPFKCDVCDKTFSRAHHLNTHKRIHTGEKPFNCDVCDKTFSQAGSLNIHQRIHTGEKPFKYDVCDKTF